MNANNFKVFMTFMYLFYSEVLPIKSLLIFCKVVVFQVSCKNTYVKVFVRFMLFLWECD